MKKGPKIYWTDDEIAAARAAIRLELERFAGRPRVKLKHLLQQIAHYQTDDSRSALLNTYLYSMFALIHNVNHGGLRLEQVHRLVDLLWSILRLHGLKPDHQRLAILFSDVHLVLSQTYRNTGKLWPSAWEQQMAQSFANYLTPREKARMHLSLAIRALRLGNGRMAVESCQQGLNVSDDPQVVQQLSLLQLKAIRLSGDIPAFKQMLSQLSVAGWEKNFVTEVEWENICVGASETGNLDDMIKAIKSTGSHYLQDYITEAQCWVRAVQTKKYKKKMLKLNTYAQRKDLYFDRKDSFYQFVAGLEQRENPKVPFAVRRRQVGMALDRINRLVSVDKEMLAWACTARWLIQNRSPSSARLAISEYYALSLRLSSGRQQDTLGLAAGFDQLTL